MHCPISTHITVFAKVSLNRQISDNFYANSTLITENYSHSIIGFIKKRKNVPVVNSILMPSIMWNASSLSPFFALVFYLTSQLRSLMNLIFLFLFAVLSPIYFFISFKMKGVYRSIFNSFFAVYVSR